MKLSEDQIEDILYCARVGDGTELLEAVDECIPSAVPAGEGDQAVERTDKAKQRSAILADVANQSGNTPLHYAAANGHLETVKTLLSLLPSPALLRTNESGNTPVHWAALNGHLAVVQSLVDAIQSLQPPRPSAPVSSPALAADTDEARRAADAAAEAEAEAREDEEVQERPAWDVPNKAGRGPMSEAQLGGHENVVQWLLEHMVLGGSQGKTDEVVPEQDVDGTASVTNGVRSLQVDAKDGPAS